MSIAFFKEGISQYDRRYLYGFCFWLHTIASSGIKESSGPAELSLSWQMCSVKNTSHLIFVSQSNFSIAQSVRSSIALESKISTTSLRRKCNRRLCLRGMVSAFGGLICLLSLWGCAPKKGTEPGAHSVALLPHKKVALVFSKTSAEHFYDRVAYGQLMASVQQQFRLAGLFFDFLTEDELAACTDCSKYGAIVLPSSIMLSEAIELPSSKS